MSDNLDKTQPMPKITDDMLGQDTQVVNHSRVRQLEPVNVNNHRQGTAYQGGVNDGFQRQQMPGSNPSPKKKGGCAKTVLLLLIAFIAAMAVGLFISGYVSDHNSREAAYKQQQEQSDKNVRATAEQKESLSERRAELNQRIKDLEEQKKNAQSEADTLKGKSEQMDKNQKDKSGMEKVFDKVTGKEAQEKKDAKDLSQQEKSAADKLAEINQSIQDAKEAYNEVNQQLDELESMRQKAIKTKEDAERVYNENKGLIDSIAYYVTQGISVVQGIMK